MTIESYPFVPVANCVEIAIKYVEWGQIQYNKIHVGTTGAVTSDDLVNMCSVVKDWLAATWATVVGNDCSATEIAAVDMSEPDGIYHVLPLIPVISGPYGVACAVSNATACVTMLTGRRGRSYRGRFFLAGMRQAYITGGAISVGAATAIAAALGVLDGMFWSDHPEWEGIVVVSKRTGGAWRGAGIKNKVTSYVCNPFIASQKRRLPGPGRGE